MSLPFLPEPALMALIGVVLVAVGRRGRGRLC